jgi:hypothetical protein
MFQMKDKVRDGIYALSLNFLHAEQFLGKSIKYNFDFTERAVILDRY